MRIRLQAQIAVLACAAMERICQSLLRWRAVVLLAVGLITVAACWLALSVRFEFSFTQFFPSRQHPVIDRYFDFMDSFGRDDRSALIVVLPHEGGVYQENVLRRLHALGEAVAAEPGVARVRDITHQRLLLDEDGALAWKPAINMDGPMDAAALGELRQRVDASPFLRGQLVAEDGQAAAMLVELRAVELGHERDQQQRGSLIARLRALAARHMGEQIDARVGGVPAVRAGYIELLAGETWQLLLLAALILAVVLAWLFRSARAVLLPLLTVGASTIWSIAALVLAGQSFTLMSTMIPTVVLILGIADSVHFLARYQEERERGRDEQAAIFATFKHLAVACFLTSFTTAIGFVALSSSAIDLIADFGIMAAVGVMLAYLVTMLLMPPLLSLLPIPVTRSLSASAKQPTGRFLALHFKLADRRARSIVTLFVVSLVGLTLWSLAALSRDAYFVDDLDRDDPMVQTTRTIEQHFGGILPVEVLVHGDHALQTDPRALALADQVAELLRSQPAIGGVVGVSDLMRALSVAVAGDDRALHKAAALAQIQALAEGVDDSVLRHFVADQGHTLRVSARVADLGSARMVPLLADLRKQLNDLSTREPGLSLELNGFTPAAIWVKDYMVNQLFYGFALAFVIITLTMGLLFRSPLLALLALLPNLVPLAGVLAFMTVLGIALKPTTAVIFSVSFGLGVDNTIHFLTRYRDEIAAGCDVRRAISRTLAGTGRGILFASLVLTLGFCAALFAHLQTSVHFAQLTIVTIASAQIAVLLLLPALLLLRQTRRETS